MLRITYTLIIGLLCHSFVFAQAVKKDINYSDIQTVQSEGFKFKIEYDPKGTDKIIGVLNIIGIEQAEIAKININLNGKQLGASEYISETKRLPFSISKDDLILDNSGESKGSIVFTDAGVSVTNSIEIEVTEKPEASVSAEATVVSLINTYVDKANQYIDSVGLKFDKKRNLFLKGNQVYIFLDENGRLIKTGLPTTATQEYIYRFIVISCVTCEHPANLKLNVEGDFAPSYLKFAPNEDPKNQAEQDQVEYEAIDFGTYGPFTESFEVKLSKIEKGTEKVLLRSTVNVADLYHLSISTGLFKTTLRNPINIEKVAISATTNTADSTLIADDPNTRGVLTIMATFYPAGRSFLFTPNEYKGWDRFGVVVGAQLDNQLKENFFLGASYDFARGGSLAAGIHCGRRNYIAEGDYDDFEYGRDEFIGDLRIKKEWDIGLFFGVIIDTRIAGQIFNTGGN